MTGVRTRSLVFQDANVRRYEVFLDGAHFGFEEEFAPIPADVNQAALQQQIGNALATNIAFLGLTAPTQAQAVAQVQRLTREVTALIRLAAGLLDTTDGT